MKKKLNVITPKVSDPDKGWWYDDYDVIGVANIDASSVVALIDGFDSVDVHVPDVTDATVLIVSIEGVDLFAYSDMA